MKKGLQCELFLFNKNAVPYSLRISPALEAELPIMFLYGIINEIQTDAAIGVNVVNLVDYDKRDSKQLPYLPLSDVDRVRYLVRQIEEDRAGIFEFSTHNHEFKRMKGIVAHYTHPTIKTYRSMSRSIYRRLRRFLWVMCGILMVAMQGLT